MRLVKRNLEKVEVVPLIAAVKRMYFKRIANCGDLGKKEKNHFRAIFNARLLLAVEKVD